MQPIGAAIGLVDTRNVPISVSICKLIGSVEQATGKTPTDVQIEFIDQIIVTGPNMDLKLFDGNATYDSMAVLDKVFLCKEFPIPDAKVTSIRIVHQIGLSDSIYYGAEENGKQIKIFVHMQGAFLLDQFVAEIDHALLTNFETPFYDVFLKMENFDQSHGIECMDEKHGYDACIFKDTLTFLNETLGCSLPLTRCVYCRSLDTFSSMGI